MLIALAIASLAILAIVLLNVLAWPGFRPTARRYTGSVSVLIPARNEEANIADCLQRALAQDDTVAEILVYDDHSTDATVRIVEEHVQRDGRIRLIAPGKLPPGWCGKNFACMRLAAEASARWLLFIDADARLEQGGVARMMHEATTRSVTFLSAWPQLVMRGYAERLLMPLLDFVVLTLFPAPLSLRRNDMSLALAHGACILADRDVYFRVGGHAAVRDRIFEDRRLAQQWRRCGERGLCLHGAGVVRVRMYDSLAGIWHGFRKNFRPGFEHEANFWLFLLLHAGIFLLPFLLLFLLPSYAVIFAAASILAMRLLLAIRFGHPLWPALLHPVAEVVLLALGIASWWSYRSGAGVEWKGRRYGERESHPIARAQMRRADIRRL